MKYLFLILLTSFCTTVAERDPFYYKQGTHHIVCSAVGTLNNKQYFAYMVVDGCTYIVRAHDTIGQFKVFSISLKGVVLRDAHNVTHMILLTSHK